MGILPALSTLCLKPAVEYGDPEMVAILLVVKLLANVNGADVAGYNNQLLRLAAENGDAEVVKVLLTVKEVNAGNGWRDALEAAAKMGHVDVVKLLVEVGKVDLKVDGACALEWADKKGHLEVVKVLLANGCDPDAAKISYAHLVGAMCRRAGAAKLLLYAVDHGNEG
ncbi:hypothetical protein HDU76_006455 [Blyttiomyces sp. JEL0837]|nr:hypothetical protein HDU76_006455 [Blyttiomyces sp. JEL0837]